MIKVKESNYNVKISFPRKAAKLWPEFYCANCKKKLLFKDMFMVNDSIWKKFGMGKEFLCLGCLEDRIGKSLKYPDDFTNCILNKVNNGIIGRSE